MRLSRPPRLLPLFGIQTRTANWRRSGTITLALFCATGILAAVPLTAHAGAIEIGASGSYRRVNIDQNSYQEATSLTGSISYYISEVSAFELSYTDGTSTTFNGSSDGFNHTTWAYYKMVGLDFVYTFGERDSIVRPYFKVGAAYLLQKSIVDEYQGFGSNENDDPPSVVPSAGAGLRIAITQSLSLKVGVEGWLSGDGQNDIDYSGRAGLSWMF